MNQKRLKRESIAIAKQRMQNRDVEIDEENACKVEDEGFLKEIEEVERKADEEEGRAAATPKK